LAIGDGSIASEHSPQKGIWVHWALPLEITNNLGMKMVIINAE
jgi:hypothetical protein